MVDRDGMLSRKPTDSGASLGRYEDRPDDCECDYPSVVARNMTGHALDCPSHIRKMQAIGAKPLAGVVEVAPLVEKGTIGGKTLIEVVGLLADTLFEIVKASGGQVSPAMVLALHYAEEIGWKPKPPTEEERQAAALARAQAKDAPPEGYAKSV